MTAIRPATSGAAPVPPVARPATTGPDAFAQTLRTLLQRADPDAAAPDDAAMFNERGFFAPGQDSEGEGCVSPPAPAPVPQVPIVAQAPADPLELGAVASGSALLEVAQATGPSLALSLPIALPPAATAVEARAAASPIARPRAAPDAPSVAPAPRRAAGMPARVPMVAVAILAGEQGATVSLRTPTLAEEDMESLHGAVATLLARHGVALGTLRINGQAANRGRGE
jgi:hypothetical protein